MMLKQARYFVLICAAILGSTTGMAQTVSVPMQAELSRSTTGRGIDSSGFASLSVPLPKGAVYDVIKQENGNIVLNVEGKQVVVPSGAVSVTVKPQMPLPSADGFVAGKIVLISAKYSIDGNQPRNVKNNLQKLIPETIITAPVEIFVTDALSSAAQDQSQGTITVTGGSSPNVFIRPASKNVLTVQYLFNGKKLMKVVPEGSKLLLP